MRIRKNKKARLIAVVSILLFLMSVGYAFLQTDFNVTGTAVIKNKSYNVYYSNIQTTAGSVTPTTAPTANGTSTTELNWAVSMDTPGQFYEFTVDVTNAGTVDAMIAELLNTTLTTEQAQYLTYTVTYEDYKPIEQYDKLAVSETDSIRIRLEVKPDAQPADIPSNPQITLSLGDIYAIADNNAVARTKAVKYTVAFNKNDANATGTMADQVIIQDRATPLTANAFTKTGYHFTNWATASDGSGTSYTDGQNVTNIGNVTLYARWAVNTYTIAFNANGGTGTMANKAMTYGVASNLTANSFTRSGYTFKNWNTEADGSGTTYTNSQSVNLTTEHGATVTLYAQWEEQVTKYAVQIYGINQDVDENDNVLGLTFGPAVGDNYNNAYVTHEYEEITENPGNYYVKIVTHSIDSNGTETTSSTYLTNSSGDNVTRDETEKEKYDVNIHDLTWAQISAKSKADPTVFTDCMLCGDTKSVKLSLNSTIGQNIGFYAQRGDGAGMLFYTVKNTTDAYYRTWNPRQSQNAYVGTGVTLNSNEISDGSNARNAGGYSVSHIRATLIGKNAKTNEGYAGNVNLTNDTCLYSCIESDLQAVITPKKIKYVTGTGTSSYTLNDDIADSIWLFSDREMYDTGRYSGNTTEGLDSSRVTNDTGVGYDKFANTESKYYISSYNISANTNRVRYTEAGSAGGWWLRSPSLNSTYYAHDVRSDGSINVSGYVNYSSGLAFGFCIE